MDLNKPINMFLDKKKTAWSETTLVSARAFLRNYGRFVVKVDASVFLDLLRQEGKNMYTIQTYFIHAGNFYEFLNPVKENVFRIYRKENRNVFKNAYQSKPIQTDYETVRKTLEDQPESEEKQACLYILKTAQRSGESGLLRRSGTNVNSGCNMAGSGDVRKAEERISSTIIGKGGKERINLGDKLTAPTGQSYYRVYRYLQRILSISPHTLRKLALTRAAERGANSADLCEIAGWSSITTAIRYLQPKRADKLRSFLE